MKVWCKFERIDLGELMELGSNNFILLSPEWWAEQNATPSLHLSLQMNGTDPRLRVPALIGVSVTFQRQMVDHRYR